MYLYSKKELEIMLQDWGNFFGIYSEKKDEIEKMKRNNTDNKLSLCINSLEDNLKEIMNDKTYMDNCIQALTYEHQRFLYLRYVKKLSITAIEYRLNMSRSNVFRVRNIIFNHLNEIMSGR